MSVLMPEPDNKAYRKLANVYRPFPNSTEFFATAAYFMMKCLRLGNKTKEYIPILEKLWALKAKSDRSDYLKLLKK